MKKSLYFYISILLLFLFLFIFSIKVTENININHLKNSPSYTIELDNGENVLLPKVSSEAIAYRQTNLSIWELNLILSFLVPILFLITNFSVKLRNFAKKHGKRTFLTILIYFFLYTLINFIITFPLQFYGGFIVKHSFGLSNGIFLNWFTNLIKGFSISTILGMILIWIPYLFMIKSPKRWWVYMGISSIPIIMFLTFVSPTYIDPLFNKYQPIQNESLKKSINDELEKVDLKNSKVLQVNKSSHTNEMNAYMTGIFNSKRIVLWDTTIKNLTEKEVLSVTAHEIGHYVLGHIWKGIILGGVFTTILLFLIYKLGNLIISKWGNILKFNYLHDVAALPLIILLINLFTLMSSPITNTYSRHIEREADRFQLELTRDNSSAITSTIKLHQKSLAIPYCGKLYEICFHSHPSYYERIKFAHEYSPWKRNESLKYSEYMKQ